MCDTYISALDAYIDENGHVKPQEPYSLTQYPRHTPIVVQEGEEFPNIEKKYKPSQPSTNSEKHKINKIKELVKIQCSDGNWNYDSYMFGMANGMILVLSIIEDKEPEFLNAPKRWLCDKPTTFHSLELEKELKEQLLEEMMEARDRFDIAGDILK